MTEEEFCEAVDYICELSYLKMRLPNGSFAEIIAYLEGYSVAAKLERHGHYTWTVPFGHWLAVKFKTEDNIVSMKELRAMFSSEKKAIVWLPRLYREFAGSEHLKNLRYAETQAKNVSERRVILLTDGLADADAAD